ncbi:MAG: hypothetical protein E7374_03095 [Clostridiales bacterium]|nr:hypothetical protein [Clostridiales bacterium]
MSNYQIESRTFVLEIEQITTSSRFPYSCTLTDKNGNIIGKFSFNVDDFYLGNFTEDLVSLLESAEIGGEDYLQECEKFESLPYDSESKNEALSLADSYKWHNTASNLF